MVIVTSAAGNHSNRLFQNAHLEAFCLRNCIRFWNPSFADMATFYGVKRSPFDQAFCLAVKIWKRLGLPAVTSFDDFGKGAEYYELVKRRRIVLAEGWCFRAPEIVEEYRERLARKFTLKPEFYVDNELYRELLAVDRAKTILVGVHVRRGDYREFEGGRYFFGDDVYERYMVNLAAALSARFCKKVTFIIFSNEDSSMREGPDRVISRNEWYIDQFLMGMCDYLIGPPSTFTLWASFVGGARFFHIKDDSGAVRIEDFALCVG